MARKVTYFLTRLWCRGAGRPALNRSHAAGTRAAGAGRGARFLLCASVLLVLGWPVPGTAQTTTCTATSMAVTGFTAPLDGLVTDCTTLLGLKDELRGMGTLNWAETLAMSSWEGITVAGAPPRVARLVVPSKSLTGVIPAELGDLTNLAELTLHENALTDTIPAELGDLTNLATLRLNKNALTGTIPDRLGALTSLTQLYLHDNALSGAIPAALGDLMNLQYLWLKGNALTGAIPDGVGRPHEPDNTYCSKRMHSPAPSPTELGALTNLTDLDLTSNQLIGSIPAELDKLTNLQKLHLAFNQLTGAIPAELGALTSLQNLHLHDNQLTDTIPAELDKLTSLDTIIPPQIMNSAVPSPRQLGALTLLQYLGLNGNKLIGAIPAAVGRPHAPDRLLRLNGNKLIGAIPRGSWAPSRS